VNTVCVCVCMCVLVGVFVNAKVREYCLLLAFFSVQLAAIKNVKAKRSHQQQIPTKQEQVP